MKKTVHSAEYDVVLTLLREARVRAGVSQAELGERLGLTQTHVSKYERGERRLDIVQLRTMLAALGEGLEEFIRQFEVELARRRQ